MIIEREIMGSRGLVPLQGVLKGGGGGGAPLPQTAPFFLVLHTIETRYKVVFDEYCYLTGRQAAVYQQVEVCGAYASSVSSWL